MSPQRTVHGACPLDCPDTCAWQITVDQDGRPIRIRGNPDHPVTRGGLCPKVNPWLRNAADPLRLTTPLRRIGPKGSGRFEAIGWDEAIGLLAERLTDVRTRIGGAGIWPFHGTGNLGWLQGANGPGRVWTRMGASAHNMSICSVAGHVGINSTVGGGDWLDLEDIAHAGIVVVWGSNTLVSNRHLWPFLTEARERGAPLVVIDPVATRTAAQADLHLALRPGTDAALALGACAALTRRGATDTDFLERRTVGWSEFTTVLDGWTLTRTAHETGLDPDDISTFVDLLAAHDPAAFRIGHGMQRHAGGGQAMRAVSCVPAVLGAYDRVGGGSLYSGNSMHKGYNVEHSRRSDLGERPRTLTMTNLGHNLLELDDPPVDALVVWGANPLVSNPETDLVRRGLAREDLFTTVIEIFHTETCDWADLVLPSTMQHEHLELNDSYNHRWVQWNEPAVAPPGDALPHTEIFRRLATAMGFTEPELFADDVELLTDLLDDDALRASGITIERLRVEGHRRLPERPPPSERPFRTPSQRFEFVSAAAEANGHGRLPHHVPASETRPNDGRLALVAAASEHHVNSTFAGTRTVRERTDAPRLELHPLDAADLGIEDGDDVVVSNERGSFRTVAAISDRPRRGVAVSTKGWWTNGLNATIEERDADMGGGAVFHDNAVCVRRAAGAVVTGSEARMG